MRGEKNHCRPPVKKVWHASAMFLTVTVLPPDTSTCRRPCYGQGRFMHQQSPGIFSRDASGRGQGLVFLQWNTCGRSGP